MTEDKLYLCVDSDGTELATNVQPRRLYVEMKSRATEKYIKEHPVEEYDEDKWIDSISDTDYGYFGYDYYFEGICLPSGTIEKLIGKKLSWEDEPVEFIPDIPVQEE